MMTGAAALTMCAVFTSCSHDDFETITQGQIDKAKYDQAFINYVGGSIAPEQTWGFGSVAGARFTRSIATPEVATIPVPFSASWIEEYLATAKEPTAANVVDNADNSTSWEEEGYWQEGSPAQYALNYDILYKDGNYAKYEAILIANGYDWDKTAAQMLVECPELLVKTQEATEKTWVVTKEAGSTVDEDFVLNFKIVSDYTGTITVLTTPGYTDGVENGYQRTVVVTGKWTINDNQSVGALGKVIVAPGGEIVINEGKTLSFVQEGRLVVLANETQKGKITGKGNILVTNGNAEGMENYNAGEINIGGTFNNNFGKFYNYGTLKATTYEAGAGGSSIFNHGLVHIKNGGTHDVTATPNARIYNACQWYCEDDMRAYIIEMTMGSYFYVGGELMCSGSNDGTGDPNYVSLANGAYMKVGELWNNGTSWYGPTSGWAVVELGKINYLNWEPYLPMAAGYFINNIAVSVDDKTPMHNSVKTTYEMFESVIVNGHGTDGEGNPGTGYLGNNNTTIVEKGKADITIPASEGFVAGESGCTPGYNGTPEKKEDDVYNLRVIAEDLSASDDTDFDFNDVVFDIKFDATNATIKLQAAGGTLPLYIDGNTSFEVHDLFHVDVDYMVNTNAAKLGLKGNYRNAEPVVFKLGRKIESKEEAAGIKILVLKNGELQELTAEKGEPAAKLAVDTDYDWLDERTSIKEEYPTFVKWATEEPFISKWW